MTRRHAPLLVAVAIALLSFRASGKESCIRECHAKVDCEVAVVDCLIEANRVRDAISRLKRLLKQYPDKSALARLLVVAYLADDNTFWAQRALQQSLERNPNDCETRSWLAWVYIREGDLDLAAEAMAEPGCPNSEADRIRRHILKTHIADAKSDVDGRAVALAAIEDAKEVYPEDEALRVHLRSREDPGWIEPLSMRMGVQGGYTSNARAGSPSDPSESGAGSALCRFDLFGRLVLPASRNLRPVLEGNTKGHGLAGNAVRELSYLDLSIRPGIILGGAFPRVLLAYKGNLLLINMDDRTLFYEAHRGEAELETSFGMLVFAGAGRRIFRESGRTRTELDGGLGASISLHEQVQLLLALTGRYYWAVGAPYDQVGGTGLMAGRVSFGPGFYARLGATPALDYYPGSGGERGSTAFGTEKKRFDFLIKQFEELWSPSLGGVRFGLRYEFSWRNSSADEGESNYDYMEHRFLAGVRVSLDGNPWGPRIVSSDDHVELDYGITKRAGAAFDEERVQDLLRQDEAARAGSSCVD